MKLGLYERWAGLSRCVLATLLILSGCVNLSKSFPDKHYYALNTTRTGAQSASIQDSILSIAPLRIVPRYEGREIVYRRGEFSYEADFYHEWFTLPASMVTTELERWLEESGAFAHVVNQSLPVEPTFRLEGVITALYGDYRSKTAPKGAIGLEFYLMKIDAGAETIVFRRDYRQTIDLHEDSPQALTKGWNNGLELIFTSLEQDLRLAVQQFSGRALDKSDRKKSDGARQDTGQSGKSRPGGPTVR